ncbi:MAG: sigma 54-interacting transcriptional regulator [Pseudomonadota bacterium]
MITLEVIQGVLEGHGFSVTHHGATLGRAHSNTVALPDYHLSSEHGQLFFEGDQPIYRDLRSTNGSALERSNKLTPIDSAGGYETSLKDGDLLRLGDQRNPVVLRVRIGAAGVIAAGATGHVLASRPIDNLPEVAGKIERDPVRVVTLYQVSKRLGRQLDLTETLGALADAMLELVPRATHVAIFLRNETDEQRFTVACSRARQPTIETTAVVACARGAGGSGSGRSSPERTPGAAGTPPPVRASRAVLGRVLEQRAAILLADAAQELGGSESIMGGQILSTLAVPLWYGEQIVGAIQADNRASPGVFTEYDLEIALVPGGQAALAIRNALLVSRLRIAEERLQGENLYLKNREEKRRFSNIIGSSPAMQSLLGQLERVIDTRATVCIEGETGTGKELIASAIHYQGKRRDKLFVAQNCAALPETLLESELFGHKKGSFTGADHDKKGLFELADAGTLFLDEIGEMSLGLQAKLLRVLQEGSIRPLGAIQEKQIDVRIICATNRDLASEVQGGRFRQDLYYRLMVFPIRVPPLRERREDIPTLADHFLARYTQEYRRAIPGISQATLDIMSSYDWPGNVRELDNEVQRFVIQANPGEFVEPEHLSPRLRQTSGTLTRIAPKKGTLKEMVEQVERSLIKETLCEFGGNKTRTAEALGITREGLHKKLAKLEM